MRCREAYRDPVCVFLSDTLSFGLALLEWVLVLELRTHICSMSALLVWKCMEVKYVYTVLEGM